MIPSLRHKFVLFLTENQKHCIFPQKCSGWLYLVLPAVAIPIVVIMVPHWPAEPLPPFIPAAQWRRPASKSGQYKIFSLLTKVNFAKNCAKNSGDSFLTYHRPRNPNSLECFVFTLVFMWPTILDAKIDKPAEVVPADSDFGEYRLFCPFTVYSKQFM